MGLIPTTTSDRMEPPEDGDRRTCGTCAFCRGGGELNCFWDIVSAVLDERDVDDEDVRLVCADDEACGHWRKSKWA